MDLREDEMTTIDTQTRREVRITMPTGDYQVIVMQGIAQLPKETEASKPRSRSKLLRHWGI